MITKTKQYKLRQLDNDLRIIEQQADDMGFPIDDLPEWKALNALATDYHMGERRHSKGFVYEYGKLQAQVLQAMGV
jgi:hypothetical protein